MHKDTWNALKKNPDLSGISGERVRDEFIKGVTKAKNVKIRGLIARAGEWLDAYTNDTKTHLYRNIYIMDMDEPHGA